MPNLKAAKKSIRQDKKRHAGNKAIKSDLKTMIKKLNALLSENKADEASKLLALLMSKLDKAAKKGVIHHQTADRNKSRLSTKLLKLKKS